MVEWNVHKKVEWEGFKLKYEQKLTSPTGKSPFQGGMAKTGYLTQVQASNTRHRVSISGETLDETKPVIC